MQVDHLRSWLTFGEFESECYYCGKALASGNHAVLAWKCSWHLAWGHDKDPDDLEQSVVDEIHDEMFPDREAIR